MSTEDGKQRLPLLGGYAAKRCSRRTHNAFDSSVPAPPPLTETIQLRMDEGRVFEDEVIIPALKAKWDDQCVSIAYGDHKGDKQRRIDETVAAMEAGAQVIIGGQLPDDTDGGRTGSPDVLLRTPRVSTLNVSGSGPRLIDDPATYLPVDIKHHTTLKRGQKALAHVTSFQPRFNDKGERQTAPGWSEMTSHRRDDGMQLAHYVRMLQAMGRYPEQWPNSRAVGVIGTSDFTEVTGERYGIVWHNLDKQTEKARSASAEKGWVKRSLFEVYDHEFAFRSKVAQAALGGRELVRPFGKAECSQCPYEDWCTTAAGAADASFQITVGRLTDREWRYLYDQGLGTVEALAQATPTGPLLEGFLRQAAHLPTPERRLTTAIRRARMVRDQVLLERTTHGALQVPEADIEVDFDVEWHPADGHVYQWGARVRNGQDESTATYEHSVLSFETLDDATAQSLADDFFNWLEEFVADHEDAGRTVRIFHWTSPEVTRTIRVLGGERAEALFERFLDLRRWMDEQFFARDGLALKVVAPIFGFDWKVEGAGGETSILKIEQARNATDPQAAEAAKAWLLSYNEDDCAAQSAIRDGLRRVAGVRRITEGERLTAPVGAGGDAEAVSGAFEPAVAASTPAKVPIATTPERTASSRTQGPTSPGGEGKQTEPRKLPMPAAKPLSLAEIRTRVDAFVIEWRDETSENSESQSFWNDFFNCFGINRRRVASYEKWATRASTGGKGRIDVFWPSVLIAEQKSAGAMKEDSAEQQANDYLVGGDIKPHEHPRYIITSDFATIRLTDLEAEDGPQTITFPITDFSKHVEDFAWIAGYQARKFSTAAEAAASVKAANLMANLYVALTGDADEDIVEDPDDESDQSLTVSVMMTRLLFLMFGDDSGLWEKGLFDDFLKDRTEADGSDLGSQLNALFDVLNTPEKRRSKKTDPAMLAFPHVNGELFGGREATQFFDTKMREALLEASAFEWTAISPAVFGSLFQAIKSKASRRADGEHYTTETNILKTLEPLFLDDIRADLKKAWNSPKKLRTLHATFSAKRYMDPACGCGNFLIVAYREMRKIELELLLRLRQLDGGEDDMTLDGTWELRVSLDQFYGIELNWWPAKIAETAMFLVDHQANREMAVSLGQPPDRLPIKITAHIHHHNALTIDWASVLPPTEDTVIFGNPPFLGQYTKSTEQTEDMQRVWGDKYNGYLDYVTGWHAQALNYFGKLRGRWAFVTTNSITQGDPVPALFSPIFGAGWKIKFAHRTFAWTSEASGKAAVHCVIVGFTRDNSIRPRLFDYATPKSDPHEVQVKSINAYLVDGPNVLIRKRMQPLSPDLPEVSYGSKPVDDGNLIIESEAFEAFANDPIASKYVATFVGAAELIRGLDRRCLWLKDLDSRDIQKSKILKARIEATQAFRENSKKASTRTAARTPHLFVERRQPTVPYLCIPAHVSETRRYFLSERFDASVIAGNANFTATDPDGFLFALISSSMFMAWQRAVGGRIKSDLRFSNTIVWNNLPLPAVSLKTRTKIISAGMAVQDARATRPDRSLAEHYNPLAMDPTLITAHNKLDALVDRAFGAGKTCTTERERQAVLFARYQELTNPLGA